MSKQENRNDRDTGDAGAVSPAAPKRPNELIRPIQAKLVIPRKGKKTLLADVQRTHDIFADAVATWEHVLLELRQDDALVYDPKTDTETLVKGVAFRDALATRVGKRVYSIPQEDFQAFYALIIGSYTRPGEGTAKQALAWLGPLTTAGSLGGKRRFEVLDHFGWLPGKCLLLPDADEDQDEDRSRVLQDVRAQVRLYLQQNPQAAKPTGRSPAWVLRRKGGDESWYDALLIEVETKQKEKAGPYAVQGKLEAAGLLPLIPPILQVDSEGGKAWERAAFATAAGNLNKWETDHHGMIERGEDAEKELIKHEGGRKRYGKLVDKLAEQYPRGLTFGDIRGWIAKRGDGIRDWLRKNPTATAEERKRRLVAMQKKASRRLGAMEVLGWLMAPEQQDLVSCRAGDPVMWLVELGEMRERLLTMRRYPTRTFTTRGNSRVMYDGPTNTNSPQYQLRLDGRSLFVDLPLLVPADEGGGKLRQVRRSFLTAPTQRLRGLELRNGGEDQRARYAAQDRVAMVDARVGGGFLFVKRGERKRGKKNSQETTRVYLQLSMRVPEPPTLAQNKKHLVYWSSGLGKRKDRTPPPVGACVLAVNLGLRNAVGCAIYRWMGPDTPPEHVRSFLLRLPGDCPDADECLRRRQLSEGLDAVRSAVRKLADMRRAVDTMPAGKDRDEAWQEYRDDEVAVGKLIGAVRARNARGATRGDLSAWRLNYLEATRRLLIAWDRHTKPAREAGSRDPAVSGRTAWRRMESGIAKRLGTHILAFKQARVKQTADMIVQAALGRVRMQWEQEPKPRWVRDYDGRPGQRAKTHEPVQAIIVDGIHNYRTRVQLPRGENRQLMAWCHRQIVEQVMQQAEVAGIATGEGNATNTSSHLGRNGAPGIRCHALDKHECRALISNEKAVKALCTETGWTEAAVLKLRPGGLIPADGGETVVSFAWQDNAAEGFTTRETAKADAEITAAQNIGRWYLSGFAQPVSVPCVEVDDAGQWLLTDLTEDGRVRLRGAMKANAVLFKRSDEEDVYVLYGKYPSTKRALAQTGKNKASGVERTLRIDRSGTVWGAEKWVASKAFWERTRAEVHARLALDRERTTA